MIDASRNADAEPRTVRWAVPQSGHPLGPLFVRRRSPRLGRTRLIATFGLLTSAGVLAIAIWLRPDPRGFGTHAQLGYPPCGFLLVTKLPCPTCGMTTAFAHAVRGQWIRSALAQPMGFVLALATAGIGLASLWVLATGKTWTLNWYRVSASRLVFWVFASFLVAWGFRIIVYLRATTTSP